MKAGKAQLGRIRQWTGLGVGAKPSAEADQQDLEREIEQRRIGNERLYAATEAYWNTLGKKKSLPFDILPTELDDSRLQKEMKVLPIEAVGLAMATFGEQFGDGSAYGESLLSLGKAHTQLASLQSTFARDTSNIFLTRIARSKAAMDAYALARRKLEQRTAAYESAKAKQQKSKREKRELEEELRLAKASYDEAVSDVEARAEAIQDSELDDLHYLTQFLDAQLDFVGQCHEVLQRVKENWVDESSLQKVAMPANRPRSASSPRARAPPLPRRASAKDVSDLGSSRLASRSTTSIATTVAAESFEDDADAASTKSSVKSRRARLPSFSTASDTVTSVASGLGTFGRNKTNTASASILGSSDSSRPSEGRSWSFMGRKRDTGFQAMDERELARVREGSGASGEPGKRNSQEVNEFLSGVGIGIDAAPSSAAPLRRSLTQPTSPISPAFPSASHLGVDVGAHEGFNSHHDFLGVSAFPFPSPHQPLESQATGVSVLSDGDDNPFGQTPLSPQETGQSMMGMGSNAYGDGDDGHDDEFETAALTGNRNGATQSVTRTNGNSPFGLGGTTAATLNRLRGAPPPPPPIPSGSLLGRKAPPPPPMPRRATTSFGGH